MNAYPLMKTRNTKDVP